MDKISNLLQYAYWNSDPHTPVIEAPESVMAGTECDVSICVGRKIPHPNKAEHHIRWIELFFKPIDAQFPIQIGRVEFSAHGESAEGPDTHGVFTHHCIVFYFTAEQSGTICVSSYCNIHGLWETCKALDVKKQITSKPDMEDLRK